MRAINIEASENQSVLAMQFCLFLLIFAGVALAVPIYHLIVDGEFLIYGRNHWIILIFAVPAAPFCIKLLIRHAKNSNYLIINEDGIEFFLHEDQAGASDELIIPWSRLIAIEYDNDRRQGSLGINFIFEEKGQMMTANAPFLKLEGEPQEVAKTIFDAVEFRTGQRPANDYRLPVEGLI